MTGLLPRPARRGAPALLLLLALASCASERPMTRAGEALDRTGSRVGDAMGRAAQSTGAAVQRAGDRLRDRSPPLPPPGLHDSTRTP